MAAQLSQAQEAGNAIAAARRIDISAQPVAMAANDSFGGSAGVSAQRDSVIHTAASGGQLQPLASGPSRTLGVGNRFRPAASRPTEKSK
jgi:type IV secretion system protein VirB6